MTENRWTKDTDFDVLEMSPVDPASVGLRAVVIDGEEAIVLGPISSGWCSDCESDQSTVDVAWDITIATDGEVECELLEEGAGRGMCEVCLSPVAFADEVSYMNSIGENDYDRAYDEWREARAESCL
jgi:hypothetical protein